LRELILNFTEECNSRCETCHIWAIPDPQTLSTDLVKPLFDSTKLSDLRNIYLTGGEPFLKEDFVKRVVETIQNRGIMITGATNALEPERTFEILSWINQQGVTCLPSLSLNGSKSTHDKSRGISGSYDKVQELAKMLVRENYQFDLTYVEYGQDELAHVQNMSKSYSSLFSSGPMRPGERYNNNNKPTTKIDMVCPAFKSIFVITPHGDVYACEDYRNELKAGNLYETLLDDMSFPYEETKKCKTCSMYCYMGK